MLKRGFQLLTIIWTMLIFQPTKPMKMEPDSETELQKTFKFFFIRNAKCSPFHFKIKDAEGNNLINQIHSEEEFGFFKKSEYNIEKFNYSADEPHLEDDPDPYYFLLLGNKAAYIALNMQEKENACIKLPLRATVYTFLTPPDKESSGQHQIFFEFTIDESHDRKEIVIDRIKTKLRLLEHPSCTENLTYYAGMLKKNGTTMVLGHEYDKMRTLKDYAPFDYEYDRESQSIIATERTKESWSLCLIQ